MQICKRAFIALTLAAVVAATIGVTEAKDHKPETVEKAKAPREADLGKPAPEFTLEAHDGKKVSLGDYAGKIVVLEWINPQCPFTRRHYKEDVMEDLAREYKPKGVVWLAINSTYWYDTADNKAFAKAQKLTFPVLNDADGKIGKLYGAKTTPDMRIIDAEGNLVYRGAIDNDPMGKKKADKRVNYVRQALEELLGGHEVQTPETKPYGCSVKYANFGDAELGEQAPVFTLKDADGEEVALSDYAGKYLVLEWVNPDCPFSKRHLKAGTSKTLAEEYKDKGVEWVMINSTHYQDAKRNAEMAEKYDIPLTILSDSTGEVGRRYHAKTTPDIRIIDRGGRLVYTGAIDDDPRGKKDEPSSYVRKVLDALAAGKKPPVEQTKPYGCSVKYKKGK